MIRKWKKMLVAVCTISMLATMPCVSVFAEEICIFDSSDSELVEENLETLDLVTTANEEVVGIGDITVGSGVTATFDEVTGTVEFYSDGGTLWKDWIKKSGIDVTSIVSIEVASGPVYLPADSQRIFSIREEIDGIGIQSNLSKLSLKGFNTTNVVNMSGMFEDCNGLTELDLVGFDTTNTVNMSNMFSGCENLTYLDLSGFDTSKVTNMSYMFSGYGGGELNLNSFDTSNVKNMSHMFSGYGGEELNLNSFDTSNVVDMSCMFANGSMTSLDLSSFNTSKVTDMQLMFYACENLTSLDLNSFDTSSVTDMNDMFALCSSLTSLDLRNFNTSNVTIMNGYEFIYGDHLGMFYGCSSLVSLNLSSFDTSKVTDMSYMFSNCNSLSRLNLNNFNTLNVTDMNSMFAGCSKLSSLDVTNFDTSKVTSMSSMLSGCGRLTSLDLSKLNTLNVVSMDDMFSGCQNLQNLDFSSFVTSSVINMHGMFNGCQNLQNMDLSSFDTSDVTDMSYMFYECDNLTNLNLKSFDTTNVVSMDSMFYGCTSLTNLDLSTFDTPKLTYMEAMFTGCESLASLDLSNFDTSNVAPMMALFWGCSALQYLKTPKENKTIIELPIKMYDTAGNIYEEIPVLSESIVLTRNKPGTKTDISGSVITLSTEIYTYDGKVKEPAITVKEGNSILIYGTDYLVSYADNTNAGTASVKVEGIGNYKGEQSIAFTIEKAAPKLIFASSSVDKTTLDAAFTNDLKITTDGTVTFKSSDIKVATIDSTSGEVTIKGEGSATISATAAEGMNYKSGSANYMLTVIDGRTDISELTVSLSDTSCTYDGKANEPAVTVKSGSTVLTAGTDYTVRYADNIDAGTATVKVEGIGNYKGEQSIAFAIEKAAPELIFASSSVDKTTLDAAFTNELTVTTDGTVTFKSSDIEVATIDSASGEVIIKGEGSATITAAAAEGMNYKSGSAEYSLTVVDGRKDVSGLVVTLSAISYTYDGKAKEPAVTVKDGSIVLSEGTEYTVSYTDNTDAGTATLKVIGIGSYKGEKSVTFTIDKADAELIFADSALTKKITDPVFTNVLTKTTDGTLSFKSSNTNVAIVNNSSGLVTIKGAGTATITATAAEGKNYKAGSATYSLTVKALPTPAPTPKPAVAGFSDVQDPNHAYYKAIYWAANADITKGYSDGTFGINRSCTRGEMMMFLWRYAGKPAPNNVSKSPFKDVPVNHTFYKAILWGSQKGITKGYSDGTFGVNRNVSRGECMMFLWRLKGKPAPKAVAKSPFPDVPKSHVFYNAVLWGYQKKITTGFTSGKLKGKFGVNENCSRGQIVTFLYRAK